MEILELTKEQEALLINAAITGRYTFVLLYSNDNDSPDMRNSLNQMVEAVSSLYKHELLENVSDKFKDTIQTALLNTKRKVEIYKLTDTAIKMFDITEERIIN